MLTGEASAPEGVRLYAVGDTHGHLALAQELFGIIEEDLARASVAHHRIIMLGDYCDRGPDTSGLIDFLIAQASCHDMVFLLGNHDQRMLEFAEGIDEAPFNFFRYGGLETLQSYGIEPEDDAAWPAASRALSRALPASHRKFLSSLSLFHEEGGYFFAHAGVKPGVGLGNQQAKDLIWIRHEFLQHQGDFGKVVVHGHTPWDRVDIQPNRINVDTGAYESGILSCVVLEGNTIRVLQTGSKAGQVTAS
ncbi:metallophosphoesterase [Salaquimonas pukyongi]|uniref:metallophosphoesterase n=1 Tax=Salaquimonas pukyongi TaxID=2712698 RepID=UPI00096B8E2E|nr:metallophosphoesterase [Salaquimonas pukyongi]